MKYIIITAIAIMGIIIMNVTSSQVEVQQLEYKIDSLQSIIAYKDSIAMWNTIQYNSLIHKRDLSIEESRIMDSLHFMTMSEVDYERTKRRILNAR